ncbi:hypothetical protein Cgig2_015494 [Carnegiea gigantea]|uniref:Uncharacterized protein n=1 Tax=Carnegiea gigantea TaxID=171969 RepID=A0A9Q1QH09_9CARY|nr:hypothetical protein Cgig2_015494 [Carnegiea gigantea]
MAGSPQTSRPPSIGRPPLPLPDKHSLEIVHEGSLCHGCLLKECWPPNEGIPPFPMPETPPPKTIGDNKKSTYEECKSPTHVIKEWLPFYAEEFKLKQGLEFVNLEECEKFYKSYTHHIEFSVRKPSFKKSEEGVQKYRWTKMPSSKPIFDVNDILLERCSQMMYEDKLISNNWLEFLDCMLIAEEIRINSLLLGKEFKKF